MPPQSQALLILGPHRSGTSAFTRVANLLGVDLGSEMLPPKFDNPEGYWEHRRVFDFHEQLLSRAGSAWHDYRPMSDGWCGREEVQAFQQELQALVERDFGHSSLWGVKDPRLGRLLPVWKDLLERLEISPHYVILVRNPLEVVDSLEKRDGFSRSKSLLLYLADLMAALRYTEGQQRAFVTYDSLLADWRPVVEGVARQLSLEWPRQPIEAGEEIDAFLKPSERHHQHSVDDLRDLTAIPEWIATLYEALEEASRGGGEPLASTLHQAQEHFASACTLFVPEVDLLINQLGQLTERDRAGEPPVGSHQTALAELSDQNAALSSRVEELEREGARRERRAQRAEAELSKVQGHLTAILSSPLYRSSRWVRRVWRRLARFR